MGWPDNQPAFTDRRYDGIHPSNIPNAVFSSAGITWQETKWLERREIFEEVLDGKLVFDASKTPWWTHWMIAFAHTRTDMSPQDICKIYRDRYRDSIPKLQHMSVNDEWELWLHVGDGNHRYAFEWETWDEVRLRRLLGRYLQDANRHFGPYPAAGLR